MSADHGVLRSPSTLTEVLAGRRVLASAVDPGDVRLAGAADLFTRVAQACSLTKIVAVRARWVAATASANSSDGVMYPRVLRGRPGTAIAGLEDHYFYADHCAGFLRSFGFDSAGGAGAGAITDERDWTEQVGPIEGVTSFGLGPDGELYLTQRGAGGRVRRLGSAG
ncbi:MAG: hypothetical protein KY469_18500 [Actinobacteria bacterium]|nr:hypothetical protein [Actinomycetota bacterium]